MRFILTYIFLLLSCGSAFASSCDYSRIIPHEGSELVQIPEHLRPALREGDRVFLLGIGEFDGASAYRIISRKGEERVVKFYRRERSLYFDLERFEAIEFVLQKMKDRGEKPRFRLPKNRRVISPQLLEMDSVRGRAISSIRRQDRLDRLPADILRRYRARWDALIQGFRHQRLLVEDSLKPNEMVAEVYNPVTHRRVMIDLHPGNIVVDSDGDMTIIDPF